MDAARKAMDEGRLDDAERTCARILAQAPDDSEAMYRLGAVQWQQGRREEGRRRIEAALQRAPCVPERWVFLAAVEQEAGHVAQAEAALRRALDLDPHLARAHNNLGVLMAITGRPEGALACFRAAVAADPRGIEWRCNLGSALKDRGDVAASAEQYEQVLADDPGYVPALVNLGEARLAQGRHPPAEEAYRKALAIEAGSVAAWNGLGMVLLARRCFAEALHVFEQAIAVDAACFEACANASETCLSLRRLDDAERWAHRALALRPGDPDALNSLARVARERGDAVRAADILHRVVASHPEHAKSWSNLAAVDSHASLDAAEAWLQRALAIEPGNAVARYNLATICLVRDDYERGFRLFESRFDTFTRDFAGSRGLYEALAALPMWHGEPLAGRKLLVWTEQGLGDSIMAMRYLPLLRSRGAASVAVACDPALSRLMRDCPGVDHVVSLPNAAECDFDLHCGFMSMPFLFGTSHATVPAPGPCIAVPADLSRKWQPAPGRQGLKVGLCWAGSKTLQDDARRSIPLGRFAALLRTSGIEWVSLQRDADPHELARAPARLDNAITRVDDLLDSAALVSQLDLVITVDTMIAHLAGALGIPVWMLSRHRGDWRWGLVSDRTPWYPSMTIFRQDASEDWDGVLGRLRARLQDLAIEAARGRTGTGPD